MDSVKDVIKFHRLSAGLSRRELAEYSGVSTTFLSDLESGKLTIRLDKLIDVLKVLNITLHFDSKIINEMRDEES
jgi:transcriptional regulator with XRE-family HTH domain